jgi:predicted MFS family arabinose efflux permease
MADVVQASRLRVLAAGASATLAGVGLQRFAYAPLLPAMVAAGWLGAPDAGLLGAANLGGYLLGALGAGAAARAVGVAPALRLAMLAVAACFALCAWDGGFAWLLPWRTLAGVAGGVLMGLAGPAVQAVTPPHRRGGAGGVVLTGVGVGIVVGAAIVPALLPSGLPATWLALAAAALALAAFNWTGWPRVPPPPPRAARGTLPGGAAVMIALYALSAAAGSMHVVWWPDFTVRGLGRSPEFSGALWLVYGLAACCGPSLCGRLADRRGAAAAFVWAIAVQCVADVLPLASTAAPALLLSSALAGGGMIGCTSVALARAKELAGEASGGLWRLSSAAWGASQTAAGFGLAWLYGATLSHRALLAAVGLCGVAALALALLALRGGRRADA